MMAIGTEVKIVDGLASGMVGVIVAKWGGTKVSVKCEDGNVYMKRCHQLKEIEK